jgi:hypothetical protein
MKKYSIRDLLVLTTIVALIVNTGLYLDRAHNWTRRKAQPSMKKQVVDLEKLNAQLRAELEQLKTELANEQAKRRATIPHLRVEISSI